MATERITKYTPRTLPYGEFGGPFINPLEIETIKAQGDLAIGLSTFLASHGLEIVKGHEAFVEALFLKYDPQINFADTPKGAFFSARNVEHVVSGLSFSSPMELAPHIKGAEEGILEILEWLRDTASKQKLR